MPIIHSKVSEVADGADPTLVRPSDWNADHIGTNIHDHSGSTTGGLLTGIIIVSGSVSDGNLTVFSGSSGSVVKDGGVVPGGASAFDLDIIEFFS